jgi:predicted DNA-binding protein (UPF0278 family)
MRDTASSAVKDAYTGLKALVRKRLDGRPDGELVLDRHEQAPGIWRAPLAAELDAAGARDDSGLMTAAEALMRLVDAAGMVDLLKRMSRCVQESGLLVVSGVSGAGKS